MSNGEVEKYEGQEVAPIADDFLIHVAQQAEGRIDAVVKIKQLSLKVTNASDWTDQNGKPYLQVSGSEKIANLFNISWRIDEPTCETEPDGHFTYYYKGYFSLGGRSIEVEGSRSSKDPFFKKYKYEKVEGKPDKKVELPITAIDRGDVKKAAMTNLFGNGITRILGIRNLTYADLEAFANIKKEQITTINYKTGGEKKEPIQQPQAKTEGVISEPQAKRLYAIAKGGGNDDATIKAWLKLNYGIESTKDIQKADYEAICEKAKSKLTLTEKELYDIEKCGPCLNQKLCKKLDIPTEVDKCQGIFNE